jgi:O-antigen/teichoic acid export membrane protein
MRLGQTTAIYFATRLAASVIAFFGTIYFTRTLGEEVYGFYVLTLALVSWLALIKSVGFGKAIIKRMSEGKESNKYFIAGAMIQGGLTAVAVIGVIIFQEQVNAYVSQPVAPFVILLLTISVLTGLVNSGLKGSHKVHIYGPLNMTRRIVQYLIMIAFVYIGWELTGMLLGHAVGVALMSIVGIWFVGPTLTIPQWQHVVRLIDFAKYSWLGDLRRETVRNVDILVLGAFVSSGLVGIYAAAYSLAKFLGIFGDAIRITLFPELSKQAETHDTERIRTLTTKALTYAGLLLIPGIAGAAILGDRLMLLYGDGFGIGSQVLTILFVGILIYTYSGQLRNTLSGIDRPDLAFRVNAVLVVANIVLNVGLVNAIGWVGAAIATTTSALVSLTVGYYYTRQLVKFRLPIGKVSKQCLAAALMAMFVYVARILGEVHPIAKYNELFIVLLVGFGAIIYFVVLFAISSSFRITVLNNLPIEIPRKQK